MAGLAKAILGRKIGMSQLFTEEGQAIPVTVIEAGPCIVVQRRRREKEGYDSLQFGFGEVRSGRGGKPKLNAPRAGHFAKAGVPARRTLVEFRLANCDLLEVGDEVRADLFEAGEKVQVTGVSKGKGFAGGQKRHGFSGGPASHGSMSHRRPGSGGATDAARTFKGARKPGHLGAARATVKGLTVVRVDGEKNLLVIKGAVPGPNGGLVAIVERLRAGEPAPESLAKHKPGPDDKPRKKPAAEEGES